MPAANYSFNKSHAACYAYIAYQTAYLKAYFPTEFLTALMVSDEENMERIVLEVSECEAKWISVLPPSVNESLKHFTYIDDKNIRFWLKAIKWIWDWPIDKIIESRWQSNFQDLDSFVELCWKEVVNRKSLESLIMSGAMDEFWVRKQMKISIDDIIKYCRRDEKQKETSQIWLFDNNSEFEDKLELVKSEEFSFEEKLAGEKEMIGFAVSGHALDWLKRYCARRWQNTKKLKMTFEELLELDKIQNPEKYEPPKVLEMWIDSEKETEKTKKLPPKEEIVQAVWVVIDARKLITKTWKQMMFLKCEWFDYDFEVVIFPKDVETYKDKVLLDRIVIVTGSLDINFEYKRKSIRSREIKIATVTQVREQATDLWLFDKSKRFINMNLNEIVEEEKQEVICDTWDNESCAIIAENFDEVLEEKINENIWIVWAQIMEDKFIITIPSHAKKEDLHDLKEFLLKENSWFIKVFIDLKWQEIDTKISLFDLVNLRDWIKNKWG